MSSMTVLSTWERASRFIPNGCQTLSKAPNRYVEGIYPRLLVSGHGCEVYDETGRRYLDYISGLGSNLLGYNNPAIDDAVKESINSGQVLLSLPHPKEGELADRLCGLIKQEQCKFFKTGSEANSAAVRLARAYTGRDGILLCGYSGWHDWAAITYDRPAGVPQTPSWKFKYNDLESLEGGLKHAPIAAVIMEPVQFDEPKDNFLSKAIDVAHRYGTLVIFDEIVTGLRFDVAGASHLFGVHPDLTTMGKALGNGYAISVLAGPKHLMSVFERDDFIASGTFSGELTGISAALAVLECFMHEPIWLAGSLLKTGFNALCGELGLNARCVGYSPRTKFDFPTDAHKVLFWQECAKRDVLFGYTNFPTLAHGRAIMANTLNVCRDALKIVKANWSDPISRLEGPMPRQVIR